jgi:hypothetical protein
MIQALNAQEAGRFMVNQQILAIEENRRLFTALETFAKTLEHYGYFVSIFSKTALQKLNETPAEKKEQIRHYFEQWNEWIKPNESEIGAAAIPMSAKKEINFAKTALKHYGLHINEDFWKTVQDDHVIEIYGEDGIQKYRSINFFKFCGYSLLDMSLNEWYVLWERSKKIIEGMEKDVVNTMSNVLPVHKMTVPRHLLREVLDTGDTVNFTPKACIVDFQYIGALKHNPLAPNPSAFICTASAEIVARGVDVAQFSFV